MGGGKGGPGGGERALGRVGKGKTGWVITGGNGNITGGKGTTELNAARTGVKGMTSLPTVGAETSVKTATTFFKGKGTPGTSGTVQIHGGGLGSIGDRLAGRRRSNGERTRDEEGTGRRRWRMSPRESSGSLVLLHRDGSSQVCVESGREGATSRKLKANVFSQIF